MLRKTSVCIALAVLGLGSAARAAPVLADATLTFAATETDPAHDGDHPTFYIGGELNPVGDPAVVTLTDDGIIPAPFYHYLFTEQNLAIEFYDNDTFVAQISDGDPVSFDVSIAGFAPGVQLTGVADFGNLSDFSYSYSGGVLNMVFASGYAGGTFTVATSAAPEPGAWALTLVGTAAAGLALRRRKAAVYATA